MQKSRYALVGFAVVVILGGVLAYCGFPVDKTPVKEAGLSQPATQAPVVTKPAQEATEAKAVEPEEAAPAKQSDSAPENDEAVVTKPQTVTESPIPAEHTETAPANKEDSAAIGVDVPVFDLVRVEPNGGVVIAGKSLPGAEVDVISGSRILGSVKATGNGDFVIAFDEALKPGDHSLVLRSTSVDNKVATSAQTAIVSIPDNVDGQVLALVEEPGQASRMITKPHTNDVDTAANDGKRDDAQAHKDAKTDKNDGQGNNSDARIDADVDPVTDGSAPVSSEMPIAVEAVEIEGETIYIAGHAKPDHSVMVYANEKLLGRSNVSPEGRFLVESQQPLAEGDYIIRADLLNNSQKVIASARVPFRREAGDNIAAVAPAIKGRALRENKVRQEQETTETSPNEAQSLKSTQVPNSIQAPVSAKAGQNAAQADAPALENVSGSVIIRKGDNLWTISKRTYGKGTRYTTIYLANRDQIRNPDLIWPGQVFTMPSTPLSDTDAANELRKNNLKP